jgi:hypothetical protein
MENRHANQQGSAPHGYEHRDADIHVLLKFAVSLAVLIIVVLFAMHWTFNYLSKVETLGPPASPFENARVLPPQPRLQVEPHEDLTSYCYGQKQELESYGWVDKANGVVRIPVDLAMELVLKHGLQARPAGEAARDVSAPVSEAETNVPRPIGEQGPCGYLTQPQIAEKK